LSLGGIQVQVGRSNGQNSPKIVGICPYLTVKLNFCTHQITSLLLSPSITITKSSLLPVIVIGSMDMMSKFSL